ncbi:MAG TPA: hypothetical protein VEX70_09690 [Pyrinomonadaceae bacterium]|jgi:hypothetical protein|nr:hypothetical protein [Pyrinomonadaceae bacterium]
MTIRFSRRLAIAFGILVPLGETIRRWNTWRDYPPNFFDDYIIGAFLLYGAWRVGRDVRGGQRYLAAAWAFTCGMGYSSFFGQLQSLSLNEIDPAPIPSVWVAVIKGVGLALSLLALALSLRHSAESRY